MAFDIVIAGGGLAGGLTALALARWRPELSVALVDAGATFGGNHSWSGFTSDLEVEEQVLIAPLIRHRWPGTEVRFPAFTRHLPGAYQMISSVDFHQHVAASLPAKAQFLGQTITELSPTGVRFADGRFLDATAVLDARGMPQARHLRLGWQAFVGLEVELAADHGLETPVIMDATVAQRDGYRFVYLLPFSPRTLLIEDTYYRDHPALDEAEITARIRSYAETQGWRIARVIREERGVLPIATGGDIAAHLAQVPAGIAPVGMKAALFHPLTGYSLPDAARLAVKIARWPDPATLVSMICAHARAMWRQRRFYRLLARLLFHAARPDERWRVLQHFYRRDAGLVARFYAGHSSLHDRLRILSGRPPVAIHRAIAALVRGG